MFEIQKAGPPYLFRYRNNNENTLSELAENYIYFPNSINLNDPFDSSHKLINLNEEELILEKSKKIITSKFDNKDLVKYFNEKYSSNTDFHYFLKNSLKQYIDTIGIACFSTHILNFMLWANYSNNHQGICIQYNIEYDRDFFKGLRNIEYVKNLEPIKFNMGDNEIEFINKLFFTKLSIWKEENELRLTKEKTGKHYFKKETIRNVIFGLRTPDDDKNKVISILRKNNPQVGIYQSEVLENGIGLTLTEIR